MTENLQKMLSKLNRYLEDYAESGFSAEKAEEGSFKIERPENDIFIRFSHPMTKENYVSFAAYITYNGIQIKKLYPEQEAEVRFPFCGKGKVLFFCNREGLFEIDL